MYHTPYDAYEEDDPYAGYNQNGNPVGADGSAQDIHQQQQQQNSQQNHYYDSYPMDGSQQNSAQAYYDEDYSQGHGHTPVNGNNVPGVSGTPGGVPGSAGGGGYYAPNAQMSAVGPNGEYYDPSVNGMGGYNQPLDGYSDYNQNAMPGAVPGSEMDYYPQDDGSGSASGYMDPYMQQQQHQRMMQGQGNMPMNMGPPPPPGSAANAYRPDSSQISYNARSSGASTPIYGMDYSSNVLPPGQRSREPYPAWTTENQIPVSKEEIEEIFMDLTDKFGFQRDSMRNMFDHFLTLLDSRASRMTPNQALLSLHADYIGGDNANYRKWYFSAHLDLDDAVGFRNMKLGKGSSPKKVKRSCMGKKKHVKTSPQRPNESSDDAVKRTLQELEGDHSLEAAEYRWKTQMNQMSQHERARQIALYLLIWGEAGQVRFCPETMCFIFKCMDDYLQSPLCQQRVDPVPEFEFLNNVITPLYRYIRDQGYEIVNGRFLRRERDLDKVIGYDDINQLFWYPEGIARIVLQDDTRIVDLPPEERYLKFGEVDWKRVFFKTYKERRSWFHMAVNFNRIWVIHVTVFWFYTAYNAPTIYTWRYMQLFNNQPLGQAHWSAVGTGGAIAALIQIVATLAEWSFVPRHWAGAQHLTRRLIALIVIFCINFAPTVYVFGFVPLEREDRPAHIVGVIQFFIALATLLYFSVVPLGALFGNYLSGNSRRYVASQTFTASYHKLSGYNMWMSYGVWLLVFAAKMAESYYFLTLSIRDPIRYLSTMTMDRCVGDTYMQTYLCKQHAHIVLIMMILTDLIFFFLDTYLWYIIVNTVLSVAISFYLGVSLWTPWRNIYSRLPKRIYSKILATADMEIKYKPKVLISQIWNAIVISMYREHLLAIDHVQKLLYHQVPSDVEGKRTLRAPTFFVSQDDQAQVSKDFFPLNSEAERRISFFAQSLATPMPEPLPIDNMPTFSVLVPHYAEKILLSLREIIREDDQFSRVTLLEYLKQLYPVEWDCFVKDTKILAEETSGDGGFSASDFEKDTQTTVKNKIDDLPFYCIGFKSAAPEYTLRTRIWASLRSQTLYRTVSGFMNYARAIKLLYRVENPEIVQMFGGNTEKLERELERMARRKFKFIISMQRLAKFKPDEAENAEFLLRAYPDLQIAYLDEEPPLNENEEPRIFSALIDGHCPIMENGRRRPKFRIQLSGNPILGDGKSDNQNHAIVFYRGEYIQLIDANQDNYLEECLKIRSVLAEFEEMTIENVNPYTPGIQSETPFAPVAILGAREYIFSENVGILGDIAAGKEQTFGTLFARTLSQIGGKLHYGHPDFLNGVYMTTRGGVSKAQKGLHLNEDIYAGMTALCRGGRIKHCEYYQCGKGRDLGFGSILNFTTKIGTGMGEQILSREYYYLGTQLPLDRFLSFYYAHPGFHINNLFIICSVQFFMLTLINIASLISQSIKCLYNRNLPITDVLIPTGCYNLEPVLGWVERCILSIFIVFFISFVPLCVQELMERGIWRSAVRLAKQLLSLSPLFEVFVCQIYASSILTDLSFGGARYIGTGRGFATARIPFSVLYSRFANASTYFGIRSMIMLIFATITMWKAALLWFWMSLLALVVAPVVYNPHQFSWTDFFVDYRDFIRWMSRGNTTWHKNSWIGYCRLSRTRITGYKRKTLGELSESLSGDIPRAGFSNVFFAEIFAPVIVAIACFIPYTFYNSYNGVKNVDPSNSIIRLAICSFVPIGVNAGCMLLLGSCACCAGPLFGLCCKKTPAVLAGIGHGVAVIVNVVFFEVMWFFQGWDFGGMLIGITAMFAIQRVFFKLCTIFLLTREFKHDHSNRAWWSGKWYGQKLGWMAWSQPSREFVCKTLEMSAFASDFYIGHIILFMQFPLLMIPMIDRWHSMMLFWLRPSRQIRPPIFSMKQNRLRKRIVKKYATLYFTLLIIFLCVVIIPAVAGPQMNANTINDQIKKYLPGLIQINGLNNNDTGANAPLSYFWALEYATSVKQLKSQIPMSIVITSASYPGDETFSKIYATMTKAA